MTEGYQSAFAVGVGIAALGVLLALALFRTDRGASDALAPGAVALME